MSRTRKLRDQATRRALAIVAIAAIASLVAASAVSAAKKTTHAGGTLVIDTAFIIDEGLDPGYAYAPTASLIDHAVYDTLVTFKGNATTPLPWLATSWTVSKSGKLFTFHLRHGVRFSDGTPLTSADVVFSFRRLINLKASASFMLAGVTVSAPNTSTVVLRSKTSNPALLRILATPYLSIENSKVVKAHGGTDAADAAKKDKAQPYLNTHSAGSGPYILQQYTTDQQAVLVANPNFWGHAPAFKTVVVRNMTAPTQLLNVQRGTDEIALDLSSRQASPLAKNKNLQVHLTPSSNVFYVDLNESPSVSKVTSNPHIQKAVRYALDYNSYLALAGKGAVRAAGVIPSVLAGALPAKDAVKRNLAKAKAEVAASHISRPTITLNYPEGLTVNGVDFGVLAQKTKSSLAAAGITVNLDGLPPNTMWPRYGTGVDQMTQSYWTPDYPDMNDFVVFMPGQYAGNRIKWAKGSDKPLVALTNKAMATVNDQKRARLWQEVQQRLNSQSTFMPLIQPAQAIVGSANLTNVIQNMTWLIDPSRVGTH